MLAKAIYVGLIPILTALVVIIIHIWIDPEGW